MTFGEGDTRNKVGFFKDGVFDEPLKDKDQIASLDIPSKVQEELLKILAKETQIEETDEDAISDASASSKLTVRIIDIKELKMRRAQEMPTVLGKEPNPNMPVKEHEGLKRVRMLKQKKK